MIKIKLSIDPTKEKQVVALASLLTAIGETTSHLISPRDLHSMGFRPTSMEESIIQNEAPEKAPIEAKKEPKTIKPTKETFVPEEPKTPEAKEPTTLEEIADGGPMGPTATLEGIREMLGKKVTDHREKIKAQLTKFEAKNVSVLDAGHYDDFYAFLVAL